MNVIGIMSGSSLDGLDLACCTFDNSEGLIKWSIEDARIIHFTAEWMKKLKEAPSLSGIDAMKLDAEFGIYIGEAVKQWIDEKNMKPDLIASHGHTIFHEPHQHFTVQIGSGAHIASITGVDTINNFRQADVAAGGQGAPFAPIADRDLFSGYDGFLNLGGIANFSIQLQGQHWKAWDICPCNQALNFLANKTGKRYDEDGAMAATGKIQIGLLEKLKMSFPAAATLKPSLSNAKVQSTWLDLLSTYNDDNIHDLLATTVAAIAQLINEHMASIQKTKAKILVTGGGAHNAFLLQQLNAFGREHSFTYEKPGNQIIDFKESLLMAYLGYLSYHCQPFGIASITGAKFDTIGGTFHKASQ